MATIPNGILGGISGRVGTVSGYNRYGVNVIRSAKNNVKIKATPKREKQRAKIIACNSFINAFTGTGFFGKTFPAYGHTGSGYNRAMGALMNLAIIDSPAGFIISYPLVLISNGHLPPALNPHAFQGPSSSIQFTWTDNSITGTARIDDKVILVAFFPSDNSIVYSFDATRKTGTANLFTGKTKGVIAHTWVGFLSYDGKDASCSLYSGEVML